MSVTFEHLMESRLHGLLKGVSNYTIRDRTLIVYENVIHIMPFVIASIEGWNRYYPDNKWSIVYGMDANTPMRLSTMKGIDDP